MHLIGIPVLLLPLKDILQDLLFLPWSINLLCSSLFWYLSFWHDQSALLLTMLRCTFSFLAFICFLLLSGWHEQWKICFGIMLAGVVYPSSGVVIAWRSSKSYLWQASWYLKKRRQQIQQGKKQQELLVYCWRKRDVVIIAGLSFRNKNEKKRNTT